MANQYGLDVSTFAGAGGAVDIDPRTPTISGARPVLESCARRLMTPRGSLRWDPAYGYDLREKLGMRINAVARERVKADIIAELSKDERVLSVAVAEFSESSPGAWRIRIRVGLAQGPFTLVLAASQLTIDLLRIDNG